MSTHLRLDRRRPGRQRGVAIITALLLTTLAITIVASLFWQQQVQIRSIENQRLQLQKQWVLRGALDWAQLILREDAKYTTTDNLDEPWAVPLQPTRLDQYVEKDSVDGDVATTQLSGQMIDAQSRFNLTNLATNGVPNPSEIEAFQRLLSFVGVDPQLAVAVAAMVAESQSVPRDLSPAGRQSALTGGATPAKPRVLPMTQTD
ncbi:MAG: type II secretion system minor pseudopilin GspK, partial [Burkholderiaceae bacterium]